VPVSEDSCAATGTSSTPSNGGATRECGASCAPHVTEDSTYKCGASHAPHVTEDSTYRETTARRDELRTFFAESVGERPGREPSAPAPVTVRNYEMDFSISETSRGAENSKRSSSRSGAEGLFGMSRRIRRPAKCWGSGSTSWSGAPHRGVWGESCAVFSLTSATAFSGYDRRSGTTNPSNLEGRRQSKKLLSETPRIVRELSAFHDAHEVGLTEDSEYEHFGLRGYLGAQLVVRGDVMGTIFFASTDRGAVSFDDAEQIFVRLRAQWVSRELERERDAERVPGCLPFQGPERELTAPRPGPFRLRHPQSRSPASRASSRNAGSRSSRSS